MTERGGRSLWTLISSVVGPPVKCNIPVGRGTLAGSAAAHGESRVSSNGQCVAIVVRKLSRK